MTFLLDSSAVIAMLRGQPRLTVRMRQHLPGDFAMPSIVAHELYYGAYRSERRSENVARVAAIPFAVLEFDREDARHAGEIRAHLTSAGAQIGPYDVLIAAQALSRQLTLVSHNMREFLRVPGLRVEDWEAE